MSQTREKRDSLALNRACFKRYENTMIFCLFVFIFCLKPMVTEQQMRTITVTTMVFLFESTILKSLDHNYVESSFATIKRHFDNGIWNNTLQLKILRAWINIGTNYFLSKLLETKIDKRAWKIIYKIIRPCSSKNIPPRHCSFLFLLDKMSF